MVSGNAPRGVSGQANDVVALLCETVRSAGCTEVSQPVQRRDRRTVCTRASLTGGSSLCWTSGVTFAQIVRLQRENFSLCYFSPNAIRQVAKQLANHHSGQRVEASTVGCRWRSNTPSKHGSWLNVAEKPPQRMSGRRFAQLVQDARSPSQDAPRGKTTQRGTLRPRRHQAGILSRSGFYSGQVGFDRRGEAETAEGH